MAGPPLVEAALGVKLKPEEIGDAQVHSKSGVIDVLAEDPAEAIREARKYLAFFAGPHEPGPAPDTLALRELVPENPRRAYNVRLAIKGICDEGSFQEFKRDFGKAMVIGLGRIEGRPVGIIANQPMVIAGAMDSPACDKAARMIQICDAYDIPILFLADTPGLMVGPDVEKTAIVRHSARVLTAAATSTVPMMTVVLRKAYGLGYYVMGSPALYPSLCIAWPTAEFGGMGLEGAVNIIYREELEAEVDTNKRKELHKQFTNELKSRNTAIRYAERFKVDDVIDPADTRRILAQTMKAFPPVLPRDHRKRMVDPW
jgi:acetyl-CoA carboxylase carboxyltransferase component